MNYDRIFFKVDLEKKQNYYAIARILKTKTYYDKIT